MERLTVIEWGICMNDIDLLAQIKSLQEKAGSNTDFWEELSDDEKASIKRGLKDIEECKVISHAEVRAKYEKYL